MLFNIVRCEMFDKNMVRAILSRDGKIVSHLDDNSDGVISDGVYVYREEPEPVADAVPGMGRPVRMFRRSMRIETIDMFSGIVWREVGVSMDFEPIASGWCDDVLVGVCRASDDMDRMKIAPSMLWRMFASDYAWLGTTAKGLTHRHHISERHARRYLDKLEALDSALVTVMSGMSRQLKDEPPRMTAAEHDRYFAELQWYDSGIPKDFVMQLAEATQ